MSLTASTSPAGVARAAEVLRAGGVLLYPTETVYGLGCDPSDRAAVARIRALKGRDADKPMLALTDTWERVAGWYEDGGDTHRRLMAFEGPLTILLRASAGAPATLVGPEGLVGVRRTQDPFCRALVAASGVPLVSTSANPAGAPAPAAFEAVAREIRSGVALAVDAGAPLAGAPSTVVRLDGDDIVVVREGAVSAAAVRDAVG